MIKVEQKVVGTWGDSETSWVYHSSALATNGMDQQATQHRTKPAISFILSKEFSA